MSAPGDNHTHSVHLTQEDFESFQTGSLTETELIHFMEHIGSCIHCANLFAAFSEQDMAFMPPDFKRDVVTEASRLSKTVRSARQAFHRYCLQVAFSAGAALVLIFAGSSINLSQLPKPAVPKTNFSVTGYLNEQLDQFTNYLSDSWEDLLHDKKEK